MGVVALIIVVLFVVMVLSWLPNEEYKCPECGYRTNDRQMAAGHNHLHSLHKIPL